MLEFIIRLNHMQLWWIMLTTLTLWSRNSTTAIWPWAAAHISGVKPSSSCRFIAASDWQRDKIQTSVNHHSTNLSRQIAKTTHFIWLQSLTLFYSAGQVDHFALCCKLVNGQSWKNQQQTNKIKLLNRIISVNYYFDMRSFFLSFCTAHQKLDEIYVSLMEKIAIYADDPLQKFSPPLTLNIS